MKKIMLSLGLMFAALTLTNCSNEILEEVAPEVNGKAFAVTASTPSTRTVADGYDTDWVANDALTIFHVANGTTKYDGSFTTSAEELGIFKGTTTADFTAENTWYAIYPANTYNSSKNPTKTAYDNVGYPATTQNGNNSMAHVAGDYAPLYGITTTAAGEDKVNFTMHHLTTLMKFVVKNQSEEPFTVSSITFKNSAQDFVGTYHLNLTGEKVEYISSGADYVKKEAVLTVTNGEAIAAGSEAYFYLPVKPHTAAVGETIDITVVTDKAVIVRSKEVATATEFAAGKVNAMNITATADDFAATGIALPYEDDFSWATGTNEISSGKNGYTFTKVYANNGEIKFGASSAAGLIKTPALDLSQKFTIVLKAKSYSSNDVTNLKVIVDNTTVATTTLTTDYASYYYVCDAATAYSTITLTPNSSDKARGYIDEIKVLAGEVAPTAEVSITTGIATAIVSETGTTATLNAAIKTAHVTDEVITAGFEYKLTEDSEYISIDGTIDGNSVSADITDLTAGAEYTFRAWAKINEGEKIYGETAVFTPSVQGSVQTYNVNLSCKFADKGSTGWKSSYEAHSFSYDDATIKFTSASKQSQTITTCPVTKGQPVEVIMKNNAILSKVKFNLKQWNTKAQTVTLHTSTDGGSSYTKTDPSVTSSNFVLTCENLPEGCNAVKITFSSTNNQVGIESVDVTYTK